MTHPKVSEEAVKAAVRLETPNALAVRAFIAENFPAAPLEDEATYELFVFSLLQAAAPILQREERERREEIEAELRRSREDANSARAVALHAEEQQDKAEAVLDSARAEEAERLKKALLDDPHTLKGIVKFMDLDDRGTAEGIFDKVAATLDS